MGSNLTAPRRRRCPSHAIHGLVGPTPARVRGRTMPGLDECEEGPWTVRQRLARGMSRWSVILGWEDWAVGSRVPKGATPPPLGCAEDTQKSLLASAGELRCEQNGRQSRRDRAYTRRRLVLRELIDPMDGEYCNNFFVSTTVRARATAIVTAKYTAHVGAELLAGVLCASVVLSHSSGSAVAQESPSLSKPICYCTLLRAVLERMRNRRHGNNSPSKPHAVDRQVPSLRHSPNHSCNSTLFAPGSSSTATGAHPRPPSARRHIDAP